MESGWQHTVNFAEFDKKRVEVEFTRSNGSVVFRGKAAFQSDSSLGRILRIQSELEEPGDPEVILVEEQWQGRIIADPDNGCRFRFLPASVNKSN